MTRLKSKQPSLISFHCNCHVAVLIANHACDKLAGYLDDIIPFKYGIFSQKPKEAEVI